MRDDDIILKEAVAVSAQASRYEGQTNFVLGDLAVEYVERDKNHIPSRIDKFAEALPFHSRDQVYSYYKVSLAYPDKTERNPDVPWTIYRDIRSNVEVRAKLKRVMRRKPPKSKSGRWTAAALRKELGLPEIRNEIPKDPAKMVALAVEMLGNPSVVSQLTRDESTIGTLGQILADNPELAVKIFKAEIGAKDKTRTKITKKDLDLAMEVSDMVATIHRSERLVEKVIERAGEINLPADWRTDDLKSASARLSERAELLSKFVEGVLSLDQALDLILKEA
jgi:hypothetical protein